MTLGPGKSAVLSIPLPPWLVSSMQGGASLTYTNGPVIESRPLHFERMVEVYLDGEPAASINIEWEEEPERRWPRLWRKLMRRPFLHADVRLV